MKFIIKNFEPLPGFEQLWPHRKLKNFIVTRDVRFSEARILRNIVAECIDDYGSYLGAHHLSQRLQFYDAVAAGIRYDGNAYSIVFKLDASVWRMFDCTNTS